MSGWNFESVTELLGIMRDADITDSLMWDKPGGPDSIKFAINCSDVFWWGCADAVDITPEHLPTLRSAAQEMSDLAGLFFCCQMREMRPQGAYYKYISRNEWSTFDALGPERSLSEPGNTAKPELVVR